MIQIKKTGGLKTKGIYKINEKNNPLVSVITVVKNGDKHIERTIKSVINQTYKNIEYIIIDGNSTDRTLEIITHYENQIDYWVSEVDNGISEAFNKGIKIANGELIGIINADDWFEENTVETIVDNLNDTYSIYCGNLRMYDLNLKLIKTRISRPYLLPVGMYVMHPTVFIKKCAYENNYFDPSFKIAMDYDLLLRLRNKGHKIKAINENLCNMLIGGISCNFTKMRIEERIIMKKHISSIWYLLAQIKIYLESLGTMMFKKEPIRVEAK